MKISKLLVVASIYLYLVFPALASETGVAELQLNISLQEVESFIGKPVQQSLRDGFTIWWYESIDPITADFVYFKNNQVVMTSESLIDTEQSLDQYMQKYAQPEKSVYKYKNAEEDMVQMLMHIYNSEGFAVQTSGTTIVSPVVRRFTFIPTTLESFFENLAPDLLGNQELAISPETVKKPVVSPDIFPVKKPLSIYLMQPAFLVAITLIIILLVVLVFMQRKKR